MRGKDYREFIYACYVACRAARAQAIKAGNRGRPTSLAHNRPRPNYPAPRTVIRLHAFLTDRPVIPRVRPIIRRSKADHPESPLADRGQGTTAVHVEQTEAPAD